MNFVGDMHTLSALHVIVCPPLPLQTLPSRYVKDIEEPQSRANHYNSGAEEGSQFRGGAK